MQKSFTPVVSCRRSGTSCR